MANESTGPASDRAETCRYLVAAETEPRWAARTDRSTWCIALPSHVNELESERPNPLDHTVQGSLVRKFGAQSREARPSWKDQDH